MEEFPLCRTPAPGALSMTTLDVNQRSEVLSEKVFGQEVHADSDRCACIFFALYFFQLRPIAHRIYRCGEPHPLKSRDAWQ